ncbi:unnamed protein product [Auanema sp. JU1783]|nr:unnamed protein product [Auanema sp. JU1783]
MLCFTLLQAGFKATYGRYDDSIQNPIKIPAKAAWLLQEMPSFIIPVYYLIICNSWEGRFVLLLFIIHYAQR